MALKLAAPRARADAGLPILAVCLVVLVGLIYGNYLFGDRLFIFTKAGSDTYYAYWPFDWHLSEMLHGGRLPRWTFRSVLGKQVIPWGVLLNPFALLVLALPPALQPGGYAVKMALECVSAALLWRCFLGSLGIRGTTAIALPLLFGFNGYLVLWGQHSSFGIVFSLVPLTLWSYEHFLHSRRWWPLVLALAFFIATSWYFFAMFSVFFALYLAGKLLAGPRSGLRDLARGVLQVGLCAVAALLLSAWVIVPTLAYLRTSPRIEISQRFDLLALFPLPYYAGLLRVYSNNVFGVDAGYRGPLNEFELPQLACGLLTLLLLPQFFRLAPRRERWWAGLTLGVLACSLVNPFVAQVFVAFTGFTYRHSYVWIVFCLYLAARVLHWLEEGRRPHRGLLAATAALLCLPPALLAAGALGIRAGLLRVPEHVAAQGLALMRYLRPAATMQDFMFTLREEFAPVLAAEMGKALLWLLAYAAVLALLLPHRRRLALAALLGLVVAELAVFNHPTVNQRATLPRDYAQRRQGYFDATLDALALLRAQDPSWFRVDKAFLSVFLNDPLFQGYFGTTGYSSINEPATLNFLDALGVPTYERRGPNYVNGFGDRDLLNSLVGVKYLLAKEPLQRPGLRPFGSVGDVRILVNERALPLGFVYRRTVDQATFAAAPLWRKDLALLQGFIPGESLLARPALLREHAPEPVVFEARPPTKPAYEQEVDRALAVLRREPFVIDSFQEDRIAGRVELQEAGLLFLSIPFNRGWHATVDGRPAPVHRVNVGFIGLTIPQGTHAVELDFVPEGSRLGLAVSLLAAAVVALLAVFSRRRREDPAQPTTAP